MIGVFYDSARRAGDFRYASGTLIGEGFDYETVILNALLLDAPAKPGDVLPPGTPPSGYWADVFFPGTVTGSRLWLLRNAVPNEANAARAKAYADEAVRPLISAGYLRKVEVITEIKKNAIWLEAKAFPMTGKPKALGLVRVT
ncbi:MAG TPA: phage GP46 family protein [Polyangiales bacterium]|nr:phage GP46 family protein [Polyangiales bacterium]